MKEEFRKICFYTVDKRVRDLLVSVEKGFFVWLMFSGLKPVCAESEHQTEHTEWNSQALSLHACSVVAETCH